MYLYEVRKYRRHIKIRFSVLERQRYCYKLLARIGSTFQDDFPIRKQPDTIQFRSKVYTIGKVYENYHINGESERPLKNIRGSFTKNLLYSMIILYARSRRLCYVY